VQLRHRAALNDAELDELDGRIIIQSIRTDSGKTSMTGISLYGRDGQRLTNVQRDTIDVEIGFGLLIRKTDMAARAELLDAFLFLKEQGVSILFSTHITTDLEKCADDITYIAKGKLIASQPLPDFMAENNAAGRGKTLEEIMVRCEKESLYEKLADERV
jgi:hypothetical protein